MNGPVLVAVHDSAAAFAAAECAIRLAAELGVSVYAIQVLPIGDGTAGPHDGVMGHVARLAEQSGVAFHGSSRSGAIAATVLDVAREIRAEWIVMARVDRPGHTIPGVGSRTLRVLEFAEVPVIVVPERARPPSPATTMR